MAGLSIRHETRYDDAGPVGFGAHRLLIRPRDSLVIDGYPAPLAAVAVNDPHIISPIVYAREAQGVQTPAETVTSGQGTCRDFAWLRVEALRWLGSATMFATGSVHSASALVPGAGATHAWCEVFLPDPGWTEFDPTHGLAKSPDLIRVAATRIPAKALPISGTIRADPGETQLKVAVEVRLLDDLNEAA